MSAFICKLTDLKKSLKTIMYFLIYWFFLNFWAIFEIRRQLPAILFNPNLLTAGESQMKVILSTWTSFLCKMFYDGYYQFGSDRVNENFYLKLLLKKKSKMDHTLIWKVHWNELQVTNISICSIFHFFRNTTSTILICYYVQNNEFFLS